MARADAPDREEFAERLRVQLKARYPALSVERDAARYGLRLRGPGVDSRVSLVPLHHAVSQRPGETARLVAEFVAHAESGVTPGERPPVALTRVLWCVRTRGYLDEHSRRDALVLRPLGGELVAFVAERLPNATMRGVPRPEWEEHGEVAVAAAADRNTQVLFARLPERIRGAGRVPRDGWQLTGDLLFQGSVLCVPEVLRALADRADGDVLLAVPDRSAVLALPASSPSAAIFDRRVRRTFRDSMTPCSPDVLRTDGSSLEAVVTRAAGPRRLRDRLLGRRPAAAPDGDHRRAGTA